MRIALLAFYSILIMAGVSFADVTAEVLSYKIDDNGNIEVHTQYKIDGVEVQSRYPQENGKYYLVTRYDAGNFINTTEAEIQNRILSDVKAHAEAVGNKEWIKKNTQDIFKNRLTGVAGSKVTSVESRIRVDTNGDNITDEVWTVKTDGTKISSTPIIP